jgi:hypothetical protein
MPHMHVHKPLPPVGNSSFSVHIIAADFLKIKRFWSVYIYVYVCMYLYIHIHACVGVQTYISSLLTSSYRKLLSSVYIDTYMFACMYIYVHVCLRRTRHRCWLPPYRKIQSSVYIDIYMFVCMYVYMYALICKHTHHRFYLPRDQMFSVCIYTYIVCMHAVMHACLSVFVFVCRDVWWLTWFVKWLLFSIFSFWKIYIARGCMHA